jgi:GntR family transcriptional regulator
MDQLATPTVALAMNSLLSLMNEGKFQPGTRLPSERMLSETLQVSRTTTRLALQNLEDAGVLESHSKRGWYVRKPKNFSDRSTELESFTEVARARGFEPSADVIEAKKRRATLDEAENLSIPPGSEVIEIIRVRRLDGVPVCIDASVVAAGYCDPVLTIDLRHESVYKALQTLCGLSIYKSSYSLEAKSATKDQAVLLIIEPGEPLLQVTAKTSTADGRTVLLSLTHYRGDSYRFQAELYRGTLNY